MTRSQEIFDKAMHCANHARSRGVTITSDEIARECGVEKRVLMMLIASVYRRQPELGSTFYKAVDLPLPALERKPRKKREAEPEPEEATEVEEAPPAPEVDGTKPAEVLGQVMGWLDGLGDARAALRVLKAATAFYEFEVPTVVEGELA
jgi:hypothetical protein